MNWTIDTPRRIGDLTIAAIVEFKVLIESAGSKLTGTAEKQPLVILRLENNQVTAIDMNGHGYDADEIELLYPTAIAQILSLLENSR